MTDTPRRPLFDFTLPILDQMREILKDRGASYSDFEDNTLVWFDLMKAVGFVPANLPPGITPGIYCGLAYQFMKMSRLVFNPTHEDSWLDTANYAVLTAGIVQRAAHEHMVGQSKSPFITEGSRVPPAPQTVSPSLPQEDDDSVRLFIKIVNGLRDQVNGSPPDKRLLTLRAFHRAILGEEP